MKDAPDHCLISLSDIDFNAMPIRSTYRTIFKSSLQPQLILRARKALGLDSLASIKASCRYHYLRVTKRNINFINHSMRLREKIYTFHYSTLNKVFDKPCIDLCVDSGAVLWRSPIQPSLSIALKQGNPEFRDGEIELQFRQGSRVIYFMGFTLVPPNTIYKNNEYGILITRVQGSTGYLDFFKSANIFLSDVAVNHLLFAGVRGLAAYIGVRSIFGVSTKFQSYYALDRFDRFDKCYDKFWESLQGAKVSNSFYQLPIPYVDKDINLVSQHHRSRTRKKRAFKNSIIDSVFSSIKALNPYSANRLSDSWFTPEYQKE